MRLTRHFIAAAIAMSVLQLPGAFAQETNPEPPDVRGHLQDVIDAHVAERMRADMDGTPRHDTRAQHGIADVENVYAPARNTGTQVRHRRIPVM